MMDEIIYKGAEGIALFCRLMINEKKDLPIRSSEMGLLILAANSDIPVTPIAAADYFKVSKPMIAAMVRSLEQKELLIKNPSVQDKRSFTLQVTGSGQKLVDYTYNEYYKTMTLLHQQMGHDAFKQMTELLEQANTILLEEKNNG